MTTQKEFAGNTLATVGNILVNTPGAVKQEHNLRAKGFQAEYPHFYTAPARAAGSLLISAGLGIGTDVALQHFANAHAWEAVLAGTVIGGAHEIYSGFKGFRRFERASTHYYDPVRPQKEVKPVDSSVPTKEPEKIPGHPGKAIHNEYGRFGIKAIERVLKDAIVMGGLLIGGTAVGGVAAEQVHHGNEGALAGAALGLLGAVVYERRQARNGKERAKRVYGETVDTVQHHVRTGGRHLLPHLPIIGDVHKQVIAAKGQLNEHRQTLQTTLDQITTALPKN